MAWTVFADESRALFKSLVPVDDVTWARARGWALWKALATLVGSLSNPDKTERAGARAGWRLPGREIIEAIITDYRCSIA